MGEFLIEASITISDNVSVEKPEIIEISDSEDDMPVNNEISSTVQDSAKRKMPAAKKSLTSQPDQDSAKRSVERCHDGATVQSVQDQDSATNTVKLPSVHVSAKNQKHVMDTVSMNPKIVQTLPSGKKVSVYVCKLCGKHIKSMPRLFDHLDNHATNPYKCAECGKIYYSLYVLNQHLTANHNGKYNCSECGKHFEIHTSLYNHLKIHRDIVYCCQHEGCNYRGRSESRYKEHVKYYHLSTKMVKCNFCNEMFQTPSHQNNHKNSKHRYS